MLVGREGRERGVGLGPPFGVLIIGSMPCGVMWRSYRPLARMHYGESSFELFVMSHDRI